METETVGEQGPVESIVECLRAMGFVIEKGPRRDSFVVTSYRGTAFPLAPLLTIPSGLFREYLEQLRDRLAGEQDPFDEALSLTRIHLVEELATDHGDGLNYVSALGYRRKRGKVEFFVDQEIPQPGRRHAPASDLEWRAFPPGSDEG